VATVHHAHTVLANTFHAGQFMPTSH
jgi:hypothetical protein